ncbi:MAG: SpoIID/LytB domain-containing protein [Ruminococcus sp.]|nr:SpoIID/LytB domain-containing protein [Ruminococcus sp.]
MEIRSLARYKKQIIIAAAAICIVTGTAVALSAGGSDVEQKSTEALRDVSTQAKAAVKITETDETQTLRLADDEEIEQLVAFKKAGIEEYDMQFMPKTVVKGATKTNTEAAKPGTFKVAMPKDTSTILKPEKGEASNPGTRSIAGEYYTVYDEISGGHVTLSGHELLCRIVNSEIGDSWGEEAIKAQAVAAYTYIRFNDAAGYIPTVGLKAGYSSKIEKCVSAVEGQCIYYKGSIIDSVYSASSAGASAPSSKIWGVDYPYLRAVESAYDSKDPNFGKKKTFTEQQLRKIIEGNTGLKLSDDPKNWFEIESVFSGRYVDLMKLDGKQTINIHGSSRRVTGALMRSSIMGLSNLKSTAFEISYDNGVFTFTTYGWGHGVGMSQWGACYYAKAGYSYDQILRHYYVGTNVAVSDVNSKALERANKSQQELDEEANNSKTTNENSKEQDSTGIITESPEMSETPSADKTDKKQEEDDDEEGQPIETVAPEQEPAPEETKASDKTEEETPEAPDVVEDVEGPEGEEDVIEEPPVTEPQEDPEPAQEETTAEEEPQQADTEQK